MLLFVVNQILTLPSNPELNSCYQVCPLFHKVVLQILYCTLIWCKNCNMLQSDATKKWSTPSGINNDLMFCILNLHLSSLRYKHCRLLQVILLSFRKNIYSITIKHSATTFYLLKNDNRIILNHKVLLHEACWITVLFLVIEISFRCVTFIK